MNIFYLDEDPIIAATYHCDKHVVKMCVEAAQMLSTAHRLLDGLPIDIINEKTGKTKRVFVHNKYERELYKVTHQNHPSTRWVMETSENYRWLRLHWLALSQEYSFRYHKTHLSFSKLENALSRIPKNISDGPMTKIPLAMKKFPECINEDDPVRSYRKLYKRKSEDFDMVWTNRETPDWFLEETNSW